MNDVGTDSDDEEEEIVLKQVVARDAPYDLSPWEHLDIVMTRAPKPGVSDQDWTMLNKLMCSICLINVWSVATGCDESHFYCMACVKQMQDIRHPIHCEQCDATVVIEGLPQDNFDNVRVQHEWAVSQHCTAVCPWCQARVNMNGLSEHARNCASRIVKCLHCQDSMTLREYDQAHDGHCPEEILPCGRRTCYQAVRRRDLMDHRDVLCPAAKTWCSLCGEELQRRHVDAHHRGGSAQVPACVKISPCTDCENFFKKRLTPVFPDFRHKTTNDCRLFAFQHGGGGGGGTPASSGGDGGSAGQPSDSNECARA